jgi:tRNA(adenine34) deaminase
MPTSDEAAMPALDQAQNARLVGEVPVGAVVVRDTSPAVRRRGYNRPVTDAIRCAEIALRHAAQLLATTACPSAR